MDRHDGAKIVCLDSSIMNTKLQEELRSYPGPMTPEELEALRDLQGWIEHCIESGATFVTALRVLAHDANGILREGLPRDSVGVMPQSAGYSKYLRKPDDLSDLANEPDPNME